MNKIKIKKKKRITRPGTVFHTCNSFSGGRDQEDHSLKPTVANSSGYPNLTKPITKKGWQSDSSGKSACLVIMRP
jgi:hypothetical protein